MGDPDENDPTSNFLKWEKEALKENCPEIFERLGNEKPVKKSESLKNEHIFPPEEATPNEKDSSLLNLDQTPHEEGQQEVSKDTDVDADNKKVS